MWFLPVPHEIQIGKLCLYTEFLKNFLQISYETDTYFHVAESVTTLTLLTSPSLIENVGVLQVLAEITLFLKMGT